MSPLDQFGIRDLLSLNAPILGNLSLTNIGSYLTLAGYLTFTISLACLVAKSLIGQFYPIRSVNADSVVEGTAESSKPELKPELKPENKLKRKRDKKNDRNWANPVWADVPQHLGTRNNNKEYIAIFDLRYPLGQSLKILFADNVTHKTGHITIDGRIVWCIFYTKQSNPDGLIRKINDRKYLRAIRDYRYTTEVNPAMLMPGLENQIPELGPPRYQTPTNTWRLQKDNNARITYIH